MDRPLTVTIYPGDEAFSLYDLTYKFRFINGKHFRGDSMSKRIRVVVLSLVVLSWFATTTGAQTLYGAVPGTDSPLYIIDPITGGASVVGNIGFGVTGLAFHPITGQLYGVQAGVPGGGPTAFDRNLIRIDKTTGAGTLVGPIGLGIGGVADIAFRADGTLFGWSENTDALITINLTTGAGTLVGSDPGISTRGSGLAFNRAGTLYLAGNNGSGPLRTVNTTTGLTTAGPTLTGAPHPTQPIPAMKFHPVTDELWAINRQVAGVGTTHLIKINPATGVITPVAITVSRLDALAWSVDRRDTRVLDFDADGNDDLLFRNLQNGGVGLALMDGTTLKEAKVVAAGVPLAWQIAGVGDLNGDGKADIVARHSPTGQVGVALMNGTTVLAVQVVASTKQPAWQIGGVADLDGDGNADIVWRHTQTGDVAVWLMDGATVLAESVVASGVPLQWSIQGVHDLDGDGHADIVARNSQSGDVAVVSMDGGTILGVEFIPGVPLVWEIAGVDDLDSDGKADIVWRNSQTDDVAVSLMDGGTVLQAAVIASGVPAELQIENVADLDGDGNADIVFRNSQTGDVAVAFMNGTTVLSGSVVLPGVPLAWVIQ